MATVFCAKMNNFKVVGLKFPLVLTEMKFQKVPNLCQ